MFDFENLEVYKGAKKFNKEILKFLQDNKVIDSRPTLKNPYFGSAMLECGQKISLLN